MEQIYKYPLQVNDRFSICLPEDSKVLCVDSQRGVPYIWALVDSSDEVPLEERWFRLVGTGHVITEDEDLDYIGTFQLQNGSFIGHLFEEE